MFIVPITFASWAARAEAVVESTISRESTTVSISAACTIRRSSACWVPTRTYSVRSSSQVGSSGETPMIASIAGSRSSAWASLPPQKLERPVTRTRRAMRLEPDGAALGEHVVELLLDASPDVVGDALDEAAVVPRLGAPLVGRDRLEEADAELRGQVAHEAEQPQVREGRGDGEVQEPGEALERADLREDRHRLLRADDRDRHDRHLRVHGRLDEAAAPEATQPVAVLVELLGALAALGEDEHELALVVEQPLHVGRMGGHAADLRHQHREQRVALEEVLDGQVDRA